MALATFCTDLQIITGAVDAGRNRISDFLNNPDLDYVRLAEASWYALLSLDDASEPTPAPQLTLRKDLLLLVMPKDSADPAAPRTTTTQIDLALCVGPFVVRGSLHRRSSDSSNLDHLLAGGGRQFIPLSDVFVHYAPNTRLDDHVGLVLVNTKQLRFWAAGP